MSKSEAVSGSEPSWHAILIGTDKYPELLASDLQGCVNDATAIQRFLIDNVGVPAASIRLLTSPAGRDEDTSTAANIRAALQALTTDGVVKPGDHIILFYACHGVRLTRQNVLAASQVFYGFAAADLAESASGFTNLILDRELNQFVRQMNKCGASVTVIADTCHSGASVRAAAVGEEVSERYIRNLEMLSDADWQRFVELHPALHTAEPAARALAGGDSEKLRTSLSTDADVVFLAACQDLETAKEAAERLMGDDGITVMRRHGMLTLALLEALKKVPSEQVKSLRWMDFYDDLSQVIVARIAAIRASSQLPALEGSRERPVFGGKWRPFAPGFTVRNIGGVLRVDGGTLHGLDVGAELALYPADTADFEGATGIPAKIETAALTTSAIKLVDPAAKVADKSRARLVKLGPGVAPMLVRWNKVPPELTRATSVQPADGVVFIEEDDKPAHLEVRPWTQDKDIPAGVWGSESLSDFWDGARGGWVLVRSDLLGTPAVLPADFEPSSDDIIAYLPEQGRQLDFFPDKMERLGIALGKGLIHYAKYLRTRDLRSGDDTLRALLSVKLRCGSEDTAPPADNAIALSPELLPGSSLLEPQGSIYHITEGQWVVAELSVLRATSLELRVGILACSDDGNIIAVWPPAGQRYNFATGTTTYVGKDRFNPLFINCRADQRLSRWTLKVVAYTTAVGSEPINLTSLEQAATVQELFSKELTAAERGVIGRGPKQGERPAWYSWNLRIACHKSPGT